MGIPAPTRQPGPGLWARLWPWLLVAAVILFAGAIRVRLLNLPLERDEGEYAYGGQLLLQGVPPYQLLYSMKLPGTSLMYALGMLLFGQTAAGIHLTLILVNSLTIIFMFLLGRRLAGDFAGALSAISYGVMSVSPFVVGLAAHATHFVVLFAVPATWLLLRAGASWRPRTLFASGGLFGLAFLMKQQGVCFGAFGVAWLGWQAWRQHVCFSRAFVRHLLVFGTGLALPFVLVCALLAWAGVFHPFWFWTISYARAYEHLLTLQNGFRWYLLEHLRTTQDLSIGAWLLVLAGLLAGCWVRSLRPALFFVGAWWLFAFAGTSMGLYYRGHYFILLLPAFALGLGLAVVALQKIMPTRCLADVFQSLPVMAFGLLLAWMIYFQADLFFRWPPNVVSRQVYRDNLFAQARAAAELVQAHSAPTARLAVLGSEPEIYFYARRHSVTGYIYLFPLMEAHPYALTMQQAMAREIEAAQPDFLIQTGEAAWQPALGASRFIKDWYTNYQARFYKKVGVIGYADETAVPFWLDTTNLPASLTGADFFIYQRRTAVTNQ